jgi:hypothetical protein
VETPIEVQPNGLRPAFNRRNALMLMAAGAAGTFLDAAWLEPGHLSVTRQDIACKRLPAGLDGLRIGLLSDFHYRPDQDDELLGKVVEQIRSEKPDLIALTGDFVDSRPRVIVPLLEHLRKLQAAHGVFAVMGNHDGWNIEGESVRKLFEKAGISFLINRHSLLSIHGESLAIAGTDFFWRGKPDPSKTLKGIASDTPVLALVHEPDYFDVMAAHRNIMLQLSGHTHGGQCRVPLIGYAPVSVKYGRNYNYGEYTRGESKLFVTRGVGTTGPRIRFACPPELAVLTLRAEKTG